MGLKDKANDAGLNRRRVFIRIKHHEIRFQRGVPYYSPLGWEFQYRRGTIRNTKNGRLFSTYACSNFPKRRKFNGIR